MMGLGLGFRISACPPGSLLALPAGGDCKAGEEGHALSCLLPVNVLFTPAPSELIAWAPLGSRARCHFT